MSVLSLRKILIPLRRLISGLTFIRKMKAKEIALFDSEIPSYRPERQRLCRILHSMQHTQGDTKERELLKCVVAVKECIRGGGRHLQDVIFKH